MRSLRRLAPLAASSIVALAALPGSATAARLPPGAAPYGLLASNANFVPGKTVAERSASYRRLYRAGIRAIRLDVSWVQVEPVGKPLHDYDFRERDHEVAAITRAGLRVIPILAYGHPDYSSRGAFVGGTPLGGGIPPFYVANAQYFPPDNPADFARYARTVAHHYRRQAIGFEIWNEQNEGWRFWPPHEDPAAYGRLLCAAYGAVKRSGSSAPVLFGGVFFPAIADEPGMSGPDFVEAAYRANPKLGRCYDAMAYHPYPYPFTAPELDVPVRGSVLAARDAMHAVIARHGDGRKPLWITEVGWPTHSRAYGVSEEKQGQYVARMNAATFAQRLPVLTWYTYGDYSDPTGANQEAYFGFFRPDGTAKPSYFALRTFSRVFAGARFSADRSRALGLPPGRTNTGGRGFALQYRRRGARITALWYANESVAEGQGPGPSGGTANGATIQVRVPVRARRATIVGYLGASRTVAAHGGKLTLAVGPGPIYVVDQSPPPRSSTQGKGIGHRGA